MRAYLRCALVGALLVASPALAQQDTSPGSAPPRETPNAGPELTDAQAFSAVAGRIVGAASACDTIDKRRVSAAAEKASAVASSVVADDDELTSAQQLFVDATEFGKAAVASGSASCSAVDISLAKLEQIELP
jgi:hypothetical protein